MISASKLKTIEDFEWQPANQPEAPASQLVLDFDDFQRSNTARFIPPAIYHENWQRQELIRTQSEGMAEKLEEMGVPTRQDGPSMVMITAVTRQVTEVERFRNINFIPSMAQKNRRNMLNDLEHFLSVIDPNVAGAFARYLVATYGQRIKVKYGRLNLLKAIRKFKKKLARWRAEARVRFGIRILFQGLEFPRDADGTYHLHANILYVPPLMLNGEWEEFLAWSHAWFGTWIKDNGRIQNIREMVKYPFKPNDVRGADGHELKWLYENTFKTRIVEALDTFREWRSWKNSQNLKVGRIAGRTYLRRPQPIFAERLDDDGEKKERDRSSPENIIIARMTPGFYATLWSEPAILVMNYNPRTIFEKSRERLLEVELYSHEARAIWDAKGAPDPATALAMAAAAKADDATNVRALWRSANFYIVHNGTITSRDEGRGGFELIEDLADPPDPPENDPLAMFDGVTIQSTELPKRAAPKGDGGSICPDRGEKRWLKNTFPPKQIINELVQLFGDLCS